MKTVLEEFILTTRKQVQRGVPIYPETALYLLDRLQESIPLTWNSSVMPCNVTQPNEMFDHATCFTHLLKFKSGSCPNEGKSRVQYLEEQVAHARKEMWRYIDKCVELEGQLRSSVSNTTGEASWEKGLRTARERGKLGGRPPKHDVNTIQIVKAMYQEEAFTPQEIADAVGVSVSTMYRLLKKEA